MLLSQRASLKVFSTGKNHKPLILSDVSFNPEDKSHKVYLIIDIFADDWLILVLLAKKYKYIMRANKVVRVI